MPFSIERSESIIEDTCLSPKQIVVPCHNSKSAIACCQTDHSEWIVCHNRKRAVLDLSCNFVTTDMEIEDVVTVTGEESVDSFDPETPCIPSRGDSEVSKATVIITPAAGDDEVIKTSSVMNDDLESSNATEGSGTDETDPSDLESASDNEEPHQEPFSPPRDYSLDSSTDEGGLKDGECSTLTQNMFSGLSSSVGDLASARSSTPEPDYDDSADEVAVDSSSLGPDSESPSAVSRAMSDRSRQLLRTPSIRTCGSVDRILHRDPSPDSFRFEERQESVLRRHSVRRVKRKKSAELISPSSPGNQLPRLEVSDSVDGLDMGTDTCDGGLALNPSLRRLGHRGSPIMFLSSAGVTPVIIESTDKKIKTRKTKSDAGGNALPFSQIKGIVYDVTLKRGESGLGLIIGGTPVCITRLELGGVAMNAGLEVGDKIIRVAGMKVTKFRPEEVQKLIKTTGPYVELTVLRNSSLPSEVLTRSTTMPTSGPVGNHLQPPNCQIISGPEKASKSVKSRLKDEKFSTLHQMHKAAYNNLQMLKEAASQKNSSPAPSLMAQLESAQQTYQRLTKELSHTVHSASDALRSTKPVSRLVVSEHGPRSRSPAVPMFPSPGSANEIITMEDDLSPDEVSSSLNNGAFSDFASVENRPAHMAVFLNYVMTNGLDPSPLFFSMIADDYNKHGTTVRELARWANDIHCTFLVGHAPLKLEVDQGMVMSIEKFLAAKPDRLKELQDVFLPLNCFLASSIDRLLSDFCSKLTIGMGGCYGVNELRNNMTTEDVHSLLKKSLWKHFQQCLIDDSVRGQALACCLATFFRRHGYEGSAADTCLLDSCCTSFNVRDKKATWVKANKRGYPVRSHNMYNISYYNSVKCAICNAVVWNAFDFSFQCINCKITVHKKCLSKLSSIICTGTVRAPYIYRDPKFTGSRSPLPPEHLLSKAAGSTSLYSTGTSVFHVPLTESAAEPSAVRSSVKKSNSTPLHLRDHELPSLSSTVTSENNSKGVRVAADHHEAAICDAEFDVEPELPALESFIPKDELHKLKSKERKRQEIINELFYTERVHVCKLKMMYKIFYRPMCSRSGISQKFTQLLFPNIEEIFNLHRFLNRDFLARRKEGVVVKKVGDILLKCLAGENGEAFRLACAKFCRDQSFALEQLKLHMTRDTKLASFLQMQQMDPLCGRQELKDVLVCEMQRLSKYPLLIDGILKNTPEDKGDVTEYRDLLKMKEVAREMLDFVNEEVREQENWRKTQSLQLRLDMRHIENAKHPVLVEYSRLDLTKHTLIHDGYLTWRLTNSKQIGVYVTVFADIVLLMQPQDDKLVLRCENTVIADTKIEHSPIIRVCDLMIRDNASDKHAFFLISACKGRHRYLSQYDLVAKTKEERKRWYQCISNTIEKCTKKPAAVPASVSSRSLNEVRDTVASSVEVGPEIVEPFEVVASKVLSQQAETFREKPLRSSSTIKLKREISSVHRTLSEKRKVIEKMLSVVEDTDSGFEQNIEEVDLKEIIEASVKQVEKLQQLLRRASIGLSESWQTSPTSSFDDDNISSPSADSAFLGSDNSSSLIRRGSKARRIKMTEAQCSEINKELQQHLELFQMMEEEPADENSELLNRLLESQGKLNILTDRLTVITSSHRRPESYQSAFSSMSVDDGDEFIGEEIQC